MEDDLLITRERTLVDTNNDGIDASVDSASRELQQTFRRFVVQLHVGCGQRECSNLTCHSGRVNTAGNPIRRYNLRTAHYLALHLCSLPQRRRHCCNYLREDLATAAVGHPTTPRDPSSLPQLLSDTQSVKDLLHSAPSINLDSESVRLHQHVSQALKDAGRMPPLNGDQYLSNLQMVEKLLPCFYWLLKSLPVQRMGPWKMVNRDIISKGYAYSPRRESMPADGKFNTWLVILDGLEHEPSLRLLERTVLAIGQRRALELSLSQADQDKRHRFSTYRKSVEYQLAERLWSENSHTEILAVVVWLKKLFTKLWDSNVLVEHGSACFGLLQLLQAIHTCVPSNQAEWPEDTFRMPMISSRLDTLDSAKSFLDDYPSRNAEHIFHWHVLFSQRTLSIAFRTINHITMRQASSSVEKASALRRRGERYQYTPEEVLPRQILHAENHYLLLTVSRSKILSDVFDQLWQRRKDELRRPLRVRLGETDELEVGHDLGGVQIEFFNLVCKEALAEETGMFTIDLATGCSYFKPGSLQPLHMFELLGMLIALALYNGITLPICLPRVLYQLMRQLPQTDRRLRLDPEDVQDMFPDVARSLRSLLKEDVPGLERSFPLEANGLRFNVVDFEKSARRGHSNRMIVTDAAVSVHGRGSTPHVDFDGIRNTWPGWEIVKAHPDNTVEEVTATNKRTYASDYANFLIYDSVAPQVDAFLAGFHAADLFQESHALAILSPEKLKAHLEGATHIDINELKESARYDGYDAKSKYIQNFWKIVSAWPETKQKQLLKFVTAAERLPITGAKHLTFIIKKATPESLENLPTSSTCFGTLMLPRYATASVLDQKLSLALKFGSEGFGTG